MTVEVNLVNHSGTIFLICLFYGLHMVDEFTLGFVPWADQYLGRFDLKQNIIGNSIFFICVAAACSMYYIDQQKYLLAGMSAAMWILSNAFLHVSSTIMGREYSPGVVTATVLYIPGGLYFLSTWAGEGLLTWQNVALSFVIGGLMFMLLPTFVRSVQYRSRLAKIFHLVD